MAQKDREIKKWKGEAELWRLAFHIHAEKGESATAKEVLEELDRRLEKAASG